MPFISISVKRICGSGVLAAIIQGLGIRGQGSTGMTNSEQMNTEVRSGVQLVKIDES